MIKKYRKPYLRRRRRRLKLVFRNRFFWLGVFLLAIFLSLFYFFIFSSFFQIEEIKVIGSQRTLESEIKNIIWQAVNRKILFSSTKSIIMVNFNKINKNLLEKFPQIQRVNLDRDLPRTLIAVVTEREPIGVWCEDSDGEEEETVSSSCFLIDKEGIIFEQTQTSTGLIIKTSLKPFGIVLGERVIRKKDLEPALEICKQLKEELKIEIEEIIIVSSVHLKAKTSEDWWIYFDPTKDINWQITELSLILEKEISYQKREELEYINLRFDKIYVFPEGVLK